MIFAVMGTAPLHAASGESDLTIFGKDGSTLATFTQDDAEALGTHEIVTKTPWTNGSIRLSGVRATRLLAEAGLANVDLTVIALDDYMAVVPWSDLVERDALFATRIDGERLTFDQRGPFWLIFDFDDVPEAEMSEMASKAVWHLVQIEVE